MRSVRSLLSAGGRSLARHLDRLRDTLDTLGERLREAIARAIGQAVSEAVHEAVHLVLADRPAPPRRQSYDWSRDPPSPLWHEPEDRRWADEAGAWADDRDDEPMQRAAPAPAKFTALLVGCKAAAWWLRRTGGRFPVLTALGVGLVAAVAIAASGPLAATSVGLAGSVLGLLGLSDTVQSGVAALATFISS
jgi:hypothetical protein